MLDIFDCLNWAQVHNVFGMVFLWNSVRPTLKCNFRSLEFSMIRPSRRIRLLQWSDFIALRLWRSTHRCW